MGDPFKIVMGSTLYKPNYHELGRFLMFTEGVII